jgi:hypothetical protein
MVSARRSLITWSSREVLTGAGGSGGDNALLGMDEEVVEGTEASELGIPSWMVDEDVPKLEEAFSLFVGLNLEFLRASRENSSSSSSSS